MDLLKGILNSFAGAIFGLLLSVGSICLLYWNENRALETHRSLIEGQRVLLRADSAKRDPAQEGKLIYVSGEAKPSAPLMDPSTHLRPRALVLDRSAEIYQWVETEHRRNNADQYDYSLQWEGNLHSSQNFHVPVGHTNPASQKVASGKVTVPSAKLGVWQVPGAVLSEMDATERWLPSQKELNALPPKLSPLARIFGEYLYFAKDPSDPKVGDERVQFGIVPVGPISVIACQIGDRFGKYHTSNGGVIVLAEAGIVSPEAMFQHAFADNRMVTWLLRGLGAFLMFFGIRLLVEPLTILTDWIPFLGQIIDAGATLASVVLALAVSTITIAVAWFAARPLLSGGLVVAALGVIWLARKKKKRRS